jgi:hypothetical protein
MLVSRCQKAGQRHRIKEENRSFQDVAKLKYLGTTLTDQNCMNEEIKSRLNSGMLATIRSRVFCFPACCPGMLRLKFTKSYFFRLFCIGMKLGLSHIKGKAYAECV